MEYWSLWWQFWSSCHALSVLQNGQTTHLEIRRRFWLVYKHCGSVLLLLSRKLDTYMDVSQHSGHFLEYEQSGSGFFFQFLCKSRFAIRANRYLAFHACFEHLYSFKRIGWRCRESGEDWNAAFDFIWRFSSHKGIFYHSRRRRRSL